MTQPLAGVTVVDFTQVYMGPSCTQLLGDYGADVIKIERPGVGDLSRSSISDPDGPDNPIFLSINRNKRSVSVDTRTPEGVAVVHRLIRDADVVVSNFRSGVMERIGFGYGACRELNPRVIWASGTGFGAAGPYAHKGGQDVIAQAYSGVMWRRESQDVPLSVYPTTLADYTTGMHLMQGILLALLARGTSGEGQKVEVTMYDSMLHMQMQEACMQLNRGREINWAAMPLSGVFETTDGAVCMVGAFKENPLRDISAALELDEDLSQRPEFATLDDQFEHRPQLQAIFRERFATNSSDHWVKRLEEVDILCAPVRSLEQALDDEQTAVNKMVLEMQHPTAGRVRALDAPIRLSATPAQVRRVPPRLGEHNAEVLAEHGYAADTVAALVESKVLR
ncbi:CaiB/BaiF CoA transferase family protein [Pseudonocardia sp. TRM90224]|uniref:CaiB/BaiF CoA transferase family protein n=1 Tax=Pseudonocardia sp. TRM90224 TaxID=2812678 RepID=UPI001E430005|nr:CaiB/BaiF CoA-transferase family protein [Pseudonocardia sp. TRM90224]